MEVIASEFKAKCLHMMDEVAKTGEPIIITKRGKPIAQLMPITRKPENLFGCFKDKMKITGDIMAPINVKWDALDDNEDNLL